MAVTELNTPLYQRVGAELHKVNLETIAAQVKTVDGGTVEDKLVSLAAAVAGQTGVVVVDDIAARDAVAAPKVGDQCWVKDATGDPTVKTGAAKYIYESAEKGWVKTAEAESMDVVLKWADVQGAPASAVADIDDAVAKKHEHANKAELDKLSVSAGQVAVDGVVMRAVKIASALPDTPPADLVDGGLLIINAGA